MKKALILTLIILVALYITGAFVPIKSESLKKHFISWIEKRSGKEISIDKLYIYPLRKIEFTGLTVRESEKVILSSKKAYLKVNLLSVFQEELSARCRLKDTTFYLGNITHYYYLPSALRIILLSAGGGNLEFAEIFTTIYLEDFYFAIEDLEATGTDIKVFASGIIDRWDIVNLKTEFLFSKGLTRDIAEAQKSILHIKKDGSSNVELIINGSYGNLRTHLKKNN